MTNRAKKYTCHYCHIEVRRIGKHINHYHLNEIGYRDGFDDHRMFNKQWANNADYVSGYDQGHDDS